MVPKCATNTHTHQAGVCVRFGHCGSLTRYLHCRQFMDTASIHKHGCYYPHTHWSQIIGMLAPHTHRKVVEVGG